MLRNKNINLFSLTSLREFSLGNVYTLYYLLSLDMANSTGISLNRINHVFRNQSHITFHRSVSEKNSSYRLFLGGDSERFTGWKRGAADGDDDTAAGEAGSILAAASPLFLLLVDPSDWEISDEDEEDSDGDDGSGETRFPDAGDKSASSLIRSGKLRSAREPRILYAARSYASAASSAVSNVPNQTLAPFFAGSLISAANFPHGRCLTPR
ncbi:hypothetical protein IEQ34_014755 [Dendrobium chrysotoxum]|uniref:Uncharacterized protein n=1 Tax=Dendrobium chrysotoxum TaxID=161865 RepID=A0AAV7GMH4_DENCH|nr:hypothetical protein IEQ34_014755 [Dendrobium chrysotoxum]